MEKIQERNLKWLWLPQVLVIPAMGVGVLFALIPVVGWIFSAVCGLAVLVLLATAMIYKFYFYYQLSLDINAVCEGDGVETKSYFIRGATRDGNEAYPSEEWGYGRLNAAGVFEVISRV